MQAGLSIPSVCDKANQVLQAFILGAGLGTRLRPLTNRVPKPLIPLFHRPLVEWALESCLASGIHRFAINTHHLPDMWLDPMLGLNVQDDSEAAPCMAGNGLYARHVRWHDMPLSFFHEPELLETGGGIRNILPWLDHTTTLIHNGDVFTNLPLDSLINTHRASGNIVTLALRSTGDARHIALDATKTHVIDIRGLLNQAPGSHVFTGVYCIEPEFVDLISPGEKISVIPAFLELAKMGALGAVTLDDGVWLDLGERTSYLQAHRELALRPEIHPDSHISPNAFIERSIIGPGASIEAGAMIRDSVIWPQCSVAGDANLQQCIVFSDHPASGVHQRSDL